MREKTSSMPATIMKAAAFRTMAPITGSGRIARNIMIFGTKAQVMPKKPVRTPIRQATAPQSCLPAVVLPFPV